MTDSRTSLSDMACQVLILKRRLRDAQTLASLRVGCVVSAMEYMVENMARWFAEGVTRCQASPCFDGRGRSRPRVMA